jgi:hypothetical protein
LRFLDIALTLGGAASIIHAHFTKGLDMKRFFRKVYEYWVAFGHAIGVVMTPIWLFVVYVAVFGPSRLVAGAMRMDPLDRKMTPASSFWKTRELHPNTLEETRRQF